jgi:hypothetical protein
MSSNRPIPEGIDVIQSGADATIRRTWFSHTVWFLLFFCIAWDSFLVFWYVSALTDHKHGPMDLMAIIFPIGHLAVGVGLTYYVLCTFLNKTDLTLSSSLLTVRSYPLPWIGNKAISASDLSSFSYRQRSSGQNNNRTSFDVMFVNAANREKTLLKGLPAEEQAEYIAEALTRFYTPGKSSDL